ncbi:hypothetical protein HGI30_00920 [Paenibacillus albicereus]|uniref:Uncharacterized protein n=1 Tax=Paenibacillus albicereus TaxID=2726185 RepID=A0A6H2GSB2_9BACL|nr:hypothetical protein [Paenibacillus albicereus]QJC50304.1 hypothetical protein HGI30_00920 [Paenibacillus albicereus]
MEFIAIFGAFYAMPFLAFFFLLAMLQLFAKDKSDGLKLVASLLFGGIMWIFSMLLVLAAGG